MKKAGRLFGITCVMLIVFGLVVAAFKGSLLHYSVGWPGHAAYGISLQTPCFVAATVFGLFALFYGFARFSFSETLARWHFWLSFAGVVLYAVGYAALIYVGLQVVRQGRVHDYSKVGVLISGLGLLSGPPAFIVGQLLFATGLARTLLKKRRAIQN